MNKVNELLEQLAGCEKNLLLNKYGLKALKHTIRAGKAQRRAIKAQIKFHEFKQETFVSK